MAGKRHSRAVIRVLGGVASLLLFISPAAAQRESSEPIGGVQFDPPRAASIRLRSNQVIKGDLIGVSEELVHVRLRNGKELQYEFKSIRLMTTNDGEFRYTSAYDTFRELVEKARGLTGVTVDARAFVAGTGAAPPLPRPPIPSLPLTFEESEVLAFDTATATAGEAASAVPIPAIPTTQPQQQPTVTGSVAAQPFYETNAFRVGFLASCLAIIALWWRNRVG